MKRLIMPVGSGGSIVIRELSHVDGGVSLRVIDEHGSSVRIILNKEAVDVFIMSLGMISNQDYMKLPIPRHAIEFLIDEGKITVNEI